MKLYKRFKRAYPYSFLLEEDDLKIAFDTYVDDECERNGVIRHTPRLGRKRMSRVELDEYIANRKDLASRMRRIIGL